MIPPDAPVHLWRAQPTCEECGLVVDPKSMEHTTHKPSWDLLRVTGKACLPPLRLEGHQWIMAFVDCLGVGSGLPCPLVPGMVADTLKAVRKQTVDQALVQIGEMVCDCSQLLCEHDELKRAIEARLRKWRETL